MITPRLSCILTHLTGQVIADIGTDHAYIPIRAVQTDQCRYAIASDIRKGPCETARRNIKKFGLSHRIEVRQGPGLHPLKPGETDQIIIAGMGGPMIMNILSESEETAKASAMILQPMICQYELRKFLHSHGYTIEKEDLAAEGFKVYNILIVRHGSCAFFDHEIEYHLPPTLYKHPLFSMLLDKKEREFLKVLSGQKRSKSPDEEVIVRYQQWHEELKEIRERTEKS